MALRVEAGDVLWFNYGAYLHNEQSGLVGLLVSRPMLETGVRRRVFVSFQTSTFKRNATSLSRYSIARVGASSASCRLIDIPWQIAVGSDLQHPVVQGKRTAQVRFINWYLAKLYFAGQRDAVLATRFLEVANLMKQPQTLLEPRVALRVWRGNRGSARAAA